MLRDAEGDFRRELEAGRRRWQKQQAPRSVGEAHIRAVLSQWTGVPVCDPDEADRKALAGLETALCRDLLGQDQAAQTVARAIRRGRLGLKDPRRPVGCFLLLGPTGVGKTQLCRSLARTLFGSEEALLRFDMSEYMESHSVSRLIGSPPGYVGHEEGGTAHRAGAPEALVGGAAGRAGEGPPGCVVHPPPGDGGGGAHRRPGAENRLPKYCAGDDLQPGGPSFSPKGPAGLLPGAGGRPLRPGAGGAPGGPKHLCPEFFNRLDAALVFHPLDGQTLAAITQQLLSQTGERLSALGIGLQVEPEAVRLLAQTGAGQDYGARPLRRAIAAQVEDPAADLMLEGCLKKGDSLQVWAEEGQIRVGPTGFPNLRQS